MHFIALGNTSPPASSCRASPFLVAKSLDLDKLPGSDTVYDKLSWRNFKDIDKWFPALSIRKTFKSDLFSETLKADLPLKVVFAANLLTYDKDKEEFKRFPKANVTANLRILDLGSSDGRNPGFLNVTAPLSPPLDASRNVHDGGSNSDSLLFSSPARLQYQYKIDTDKRVSHIFDIDRVAPFFKLDHTRFYGHVRYKYDNGEILRLLSPPTCFTLAPSAKCKILPLPGLLNHIQLFFAMICTRRGIAYYIRPGGFRVGAVVLCHLASIADHGE